MTMTAQRQTDNTATKLLGAIHALEAERDEWEFAAVAATSTSYSDLGLAAAAVRLMRTLYIEGDLTQAGARHALCLANAITGAAIERRSTHA